MNTSITDASKILDAALAMTLGVVERDQDTLNIAHALVTSTDPVTREQLKPLALAILRRYRTDIEKQIGETGEGPSDELETLSARKTRIAQAVKAARLATGQ